MRIGWCQLNEKNSTQNAVSQWLKCDRNLCLTLSWTTIMATVQLPTTALMFCNYKLEELRSREPTWMHCTQNLMEMQSELMRKTVQFFFKIKMNVEEPNLSSNSLSSPSNSHFHCHCKSDNNIICLHLPVNILFFFVCFEKLRVSLHWERFFYISFLLLIHMRMHVSVGALVFVCLFESLYSTYVCNVYTALHAL